MKSKNTFRLLTAFALICVILIVLHTGIPVRPIAQVAIADTIEKWRPLSPHLEMTASKDTCSYRLWLEHLGNQIILNPSSVKIEAANGAVFHFNISKSDSLNIFWTIFRGKMLFPYFNTATDFTYDERLKITHPWPELGTLPKYEFEYESRPGGKKTGELEISREATVRLEELCHCDE